METQVPVREGTILDKQLHQPRRRGGTGPTINEIITNIVGATVSGEVGYLTVFATENALRSSTFLYEDATGVGLNTTSPEVDLHVVGRAIVAQDDDTVNTTVVGIENAGRGESLAVRRNNNIAFIAAMLVHAENASDAGPALEVQHDGIGAIQVWKKGASEVGRWSNDGNLELLAGLQTGPGSTITGNRTLAVGGPLYNEVEPPSGGCTITLPPATPAGQWVIIKDVGGTAGADVITIEADGTDTIDAGTSTSVATHYGSITLISNGTNWAVISIFNL